MIIRHAPDLRYSQVTPKDVYVNRRRFLASSAAVLGGVAAPFSALAGTKLSAGKSSYNVGSEKLTSRDIISGYNNYYEFGTGKEEPAQNAPKWKVPSPWTVQIGGEVTKPKTLDLDAIMKLAPIEERIYRHRCVEGWSIVVPWIGFSLNTLLKQVEPTGKAKFVAFETYYDPKAMLSPREAGIPFPYKEGLRLDEAMHPLVLLGMGLYGETLLNQNGAPLRLVIPWKYGFKSIKSISKITFVEKQPPTDWSAYAPNEYGFYSNVNPKRDHPRWSQAKERRLGEGFLGQGLTRDTIMFNGYGDQVASMYAGMDLIRNY
jgi:methionine sulfoxide reductase catalytic subunit